MFLDLTRGLSPLPLEGGTVKSVQYVLLGVSAALWQIPQQVPQQVPLR